MTSEIGAPADGTFDAVGSLLVEEETLLLGVAGVLVCERPEPLSTSCAHPATSNGTATSAAIRIPSG